MTGGVLFAVESVASHYGPYAFGLIVTLTLWQLVVKPELHASRTTLMAAAKMLETAAERLERAVTGGAK